ncbi:MAG TPA: endo-1,3-alpha-glucanase family glycosylhydrolase [Terriglobales bacterium]|nr:endo-1,3-alpha-glucanase family glycosylhydrolase [Terriglobales bacterium]
MSFTFRTCLPFAIALALVAAFLGCNHKAALDLHSELRSNLRAPQATEPVLLAAYQPWFGRGNHINVGYSSQDTNVLHRQISQAKDLGISGFVVNWYGPRFEYEDKAYSLLQNAAADSGFSTALMYDEDVNTSGPATDKVIVDLQYAYDRYFGPSALPSRRAYLRYNGRPVIFIFPKGGDTNWDRVRDVANSWEDPPLLIMKDINEKYAKDFDGFYAWVNPGARGWARDGRNDGSDYLENFYHRMTSQYPAKITVGAAWPGFNDTLAGWSRNRHMSARCGRTFDQSLHLYRRYYDAAHPLPFLMIVTWNDYEEGTAIERGIDTCTGGQKASMAATQP